MANPVKRVKRVQYQDFEIMRNDTTGIPLTFVKQSDQTELDVTDIEFTFTVKATEDSPTAILTLTTTGGDIAMIGVSVNRILIKGLEALPYSDKPYYDLQAEDTTGEVVTLLKGNLHIEKDITTA